MGLERIHLVADTQDLQHVLDEMEGERPRSMIQMARTGEWNHPQYGKLKITEQTLQSFVDNFYNKVRGVDLAVDPAHRPEDGAAGWIKELYKKGNELWAEVEWTPFGVQLLKDGIYRYFSIDFAPNYQDPETGKKFGPTLLGGGLTNRPFIKGMAPVLLSEEGGEENMPSIQLSDDIREMLGLGEDFTVDQLEEAIRRANAPEKKTKGGNPMSNVKLSEDVRRLLGFDEEEVNVEALQKRLSEFAKNPEAIQGVNEEAIRQWHLAEQRNQELQKQLSELQGQVKELQEKNRKAEWAKIRDKYMAQGKLNRILAEHYEKLFMENPEKVEKILKDMPVIVPLGEIGTNQAPKYDEDNPDPEQLMLAEVKAYQEKHNVTFSEAMSMVAKDKPDLIEAYQRKMRGE